MEKQNLFNSYFQSRLSLLSCSAVAVLVRRGADIDKIDIGVVDEYIHNHFSRSIRQVCIYQFFLSPSKPELISITERHTRQQWIWQ